MSKIDDLQFDLDAASRSRDTWKGLFVEANEDRIKLRAVLGECVTQLSACRLLIRDDDARRTATETVNAGRAALAAISQPNAKP